MAKKVSNDSKVDSMKDVALDDNIPAIENSLKDLLDNILSYFERFVRTKEDVASIGNKLSDYENMLDLIDIIKNVFQELTKKIDHQLQSTDGENYSELEKTMQKYEGEIRNHIRVEQQLKLYAESLQTKFDDSEKIRAELLESTKTMINGVKRDNQKLAESVRQLKEENERLRSKTELLTSQYEEKLALYPSLQARVRTLERMLYESKPNSSKTLLQSMISNPNISSGNDVLMKNVDWDYDYHKAHLKTEASNHPSYQPKNVPSNVQPRSNSVSRPKSSFKNTNAPDEYLKVKIEITKDKIKDDHNRINTRNKSTNNYERSPNDSVISKKKEPQALYNRQSGNNSSNNSLIGTANTSAQMNNTSGLHRRRKSASTNQKSKNDISKSKIDLSAILPNANNESWMSEFSGGQKSRYL